MKRAPLPAAVHCSICRSPSELPKAKIGRRPMKRLMPTGLPGPSSMNSTFGSLHQHRLAVGAISNFVDAGRADHLLGRNAVDLLGPRPHELDAAARDDEGLEAVGAQIGEQLQHRLVDELGVGPLEARMPRGREPVRARSCGTPPSVMPACVAAMISSRPFSPAAATRLHVAVEQRLERLLVLPLRMLRRQRLDAVDREGDLEVDRLLAPQRAVVVEGGDALGGRHEVRRRPPSSRARRSR